MSGATIELRSISMSFAARRGRETVEALRNVSFAVPPGELVAIVGPSGCGKSTILNLVAGFLRPTEGEVVYEGQPVSGPGPERGVMFQDYALFPWRTVQGNVEFGPFARGVPRAERRERAERLVKLVGLEGFEHRYPHELSGGMRQRCALARLLANEPRAWLMDEPLAAVDQQTRIILQDELLRIWGEERAAAEKPAVLFVTHAIDEAVHLADRIVVLARRPGQIREIVEVDLPRPRAALRSSPVAGRLIERVWGLIRDDAARAIAEETA